MEFWANSDWTEPNDNPSPELQDKYKWWPIDEDGSLGLGYVYRGGKWQKITGYEQPHFAPGFSWKDEVVPEDIETDSEGE